MTRLFLILLLVCSTALAQAQDQKKQLEQRKEQIHKEILRFRELLNKESQKEKSVLTKITENNTRIKLSEQLIANMQRQTKLLTDDIYLNQLEINKLNRELKVLKEDYAAMILKAYKSRSEQSRIMFILSSDNFLQAYKRMQYMKQYASFRKVQGEEIRGKMMKLEDLVKKLNAQKVEKEKLLAENEREKQELEKEKKEQERLVKSIQKDKKKITADIQKRQKEEKEIDRKIDRLIREAIAEANRKAAAEAAAKKGTTTTKAAPAAPASSSKIVLTKEGKLISDNFKANKGRMPWPVEKGYISMKYGIQRSPIASTVEIDNAGIDITTEPNASVRAIFGGEVMDVQIVMGTAAVLVQHGDFISVYRNLGSVSVSKGDKVSAYQTIGKVYTNPQTNKTVLKLMILQNTTRVNPEAWITPL